MRLACSALVLLALAACRPHEHGRAMAGRRTSGSATATAATLPLLDSLYPCSDCHATRATDLTRRDLEDHEAMIGRHGGAVRWCFDCHDPYDPDQRRLVSQLVSMADAQVLCSQCHPEHYGDWSKRLHGKRAGSWSGLKQFLLCPACHDSHAPKFKRIPAGRASSMAGDALAHYGE